MCASAAVAVDSSLMTASSSASWLRGVGSSETMYDEGDRSQCDGPTNHPLKISYDLSMPCHKNISLEDFLQKFAGNWHVQVVQLVQVSKQVTSV